MKYLLALVSCIFISNAYSQSDFGYLDATIIKKKGDSIICLIKREISYGDFITYKVTKDAYESQIATTDISCIKFAFKYLENIKIDNKEKLATLVVDGKTRLYNYVELQQGATREMPNSNGGMYTPHTMIVHYIIKRLDVYKEIRSKFFSYDLKPYIEDCNSLVTKIESQEYLFEDMMKIIQEYNNCKN